MFNSERGFGFITGEDGKDIYVHSTAIEGVHRYVEEEYPPITAFLKGSCIKVVFHYSSNVVAWEYLVRLVLPGNPTRKPHIDTENGISGKTLFGTSQWPRAKIHGQKAQGAKT